MFIIGVVVAAITQATAAVDEKVLLDIGLGTCSTFVYRWHGIKLGLLDPLILYVLLFTRNLSPIN